MLKKKFKARIQRSVVVAIWKQGEGCVEVYTSLAGFLQFNTEYNKSTLESYLSRKKVPFENADVKIMRTPIIERK